MRKCELCQGVARTYCESDQASLCWDCDEKVHCANFLVAKHSRSLLCHVCQSITPWKASGQKLGPTVSVCDTCVASAHCEVHDDRSVEQDNQSGGGDGDGDDEENDHVDDVDDVDETEDEDDYDGDDEEDENQVVPWSGDSQSTPPPPPVASFSCSSSEDEVSLKRIRDFADFYTDDEIGYSSSQVGSGGTGNEEAKSSLIAYRPLKQTRTTTAAKQQDHGQADSRSTAIITSLQNLQKQIITNDGEASAAILGISQLSRDQDR